MGAWGTGIFSNDTACDVRDEYRYWLEEKLPDEEAARRVLEHHAEHNGPDVWLALAATQWKLGRLDPEVKRRALQVIDEGQGLDLWEGRQVASRQKALAALREQLDRPQPPRREVKPEWAYVTDLAVGDVIAARLGERGAVALRVIWVTADKLSRWRTPVFEVYRWPESGLPSVEDLVGLEPEHGRVGYPTQITKLRRRDPDWRDVGFVLIGHWPVPNAESPRATNGFTWQAAITNLGSL